MAKKKTQIIKEAKEEEKKPAVKYNFTTATAAILVPRFRGICPNC